MYYECGNGYVLTKWAKSNSGLDGYLVCPGPSMPTQDLRGRGRKVFGINTVYPKIVPDIWIGMDKIGCYDRNILYESIPKIFRGGYWNMEVDGKFVRDFPETYFANVEKPEGKTMFDLRAHDTKFTWYKHTLGVALHIMVWMGYKTIHFAGCDLGGEKDYFDDRVLSDKNREYNRRLYRQQVDFLREFCKQGVKAGVRCVSCTEDSPINEFMQYLPVERAIERTEERHTFKGDFEIKHALDV